MRLLADENFPRVAVLALREAGHDVSWIREDAPGIGDGEVLARATAEERVLITFDKDFGELAFAARLPATSGIILFRVKTSSPLEAARLSVGALAERDDWRGYFAVVTATRLRLSPLLSMLER